MNTETLTEYQAKAVDGAHLHIEDSEPLYRIGGYAGTGKASHVDALVCTPFGLKKMRDIEVGNQVSNPDGGVAKVIGVYPQPGLQKVYWVKFIGGAKTLVTGDHLWLTGKSSRVYKGPSGKARLEIATTLQLKKYLEENKQRKRSRYPLIPLTKPVTFTLPQRKPLSISPYAIGLLIGDGGLTQPGIRFSTSDISLVNALRKAKIKCKKISGNKYDWYISGLRTELQRLGLYGCKSGTKFIPKEYWYLSIKERWALLQGLMDTDGTVGKGGDCSYCTVSSQLAKDVQWLIRSLGGKATISQKQPFYTSPEGKRLKGQVAYNLNISIPDRTKLFRLPRKLALCKKHFNGGASILRNRIVSIEYAGEGKCKCIKVDNPNGLYITDDFIVTHNTTIARHIVEQNPGAMVCAFTGKAAYRLRQKGLRQAQTIHRTIYHYDPGSDKFIKKEKEDLDGCYFLIDEGSMISAELWDDITHFELPVILLGDPGQLEPIGKDPNLMRNPDIVLDQIHRQAAGSGIIQFATNIRKGEHSWGYPSFYGNGPEGDGSVEFKKGRPTKEDAFEADIILCGRNATRHKINKWYRELMGYEIKWLICPGEKIIILKNNMELGIFNGQILTVTEARQKSNSVFEVDCYDELEEYKALPVFTGYFGQNVKYDVVKTIRGMAVADWAYCITCHKSQGSEWDNVIVIDQQCPMWSAKRWRYTAATRASKSLKYFVK